MSSRRIFVIVVAEDAHQGMLIYRYLKRCGMAEQVRIEMSPSGSGSAENWVRKQFVKETNIYRSRHAQTALIVIIDADTRSVQHRLTQLDQALRESGKPVVDADKERIARLIPKRNIETWILCLNGHTVDEEADCKNKYDEDGWIKLIPPAAEVLFQWAHSEEKLPMNCIDSLRSGIGELNHLKF